MRYKIKHIGGIDKQTISLPSSKSICNRALILNALSYSYHPIENLSDSDDTKVLDSVLNSNDSKFNIGHAGTAMRFLTAFLSKIVGEWEITGSERMQQRPIKILVEALRELGAEIEYLKEDGYPPLKITGTALVGKEIVLDGSISSQYISALLMIAPTVQGGMSIRLTNNITSKPYIKLTLKLMEEYGVGHSWDGDIITIKQQQYRPIQYRVESDWSAASYIYQIAAVTDIKRVEMPLLKLDSGQGDSAVADLFKHLGISTAEEEQSISIEKATPSRNREDILNIDFIETPDIAQTFVVLAVICNIPFHFTGLKTLKIKETDRISALIKECKKMGAEITEPSNGDLSWDGKIDSSCYSNDITIETYHDHRMAMAFAPAATKYSNLKIENPMVVTKSYPNFWEDLRLLGFQIEEI